MSELVQRYSLQLSWEDWARQRNNESLRSHIHSLSETGAYGLAVEAARAELRKRGETVEPVLR